MMSASAIRQVSRDAAIRAARENKMPFTVEAEDLQDWKGEIAAGRLPRLPFPFLGDFRSQGWTRTDRDPLFVDSSGWGTEAEPALTVRALIEDDHLTVGKAYAIVECGQFQLYLAEFERDDDSAGNDEKFSGRLTSDEENELESLLKCTAVDVTISNEGTIVLFEPLTDSAREWMAEHIQPDAQWFGSKLVLEHRYASDLADAMRADGLTINCL